MNGEVWAGEPLLLGNEHSRTVITGGNVRLSPENGQYPVSPGGQRLYSHMPAEDHFEKECRDDRTAWTYTAHRSADGGLSVWLPEKE